MNIKLYVVENTASSKIKGKYAIAKWEFSRRTRLSTESQNLKPVFL